MQATRLDTSLDGTHRQKVLLSLVATSFRSQQLKDALGCSDFNILQARLHAKVCTLRVPSLHFSCFIYVRVSVRRVASFPERAPTWLGLREHGPDDDDMWMEAASLKGAFGKLNLLRKAQEAVEKAAAERVAAAPCAPPAEYAPSGNEGEDGDEAAIRMVIEEEEARLDDIVASAEDCQLGDCADMQEDLVEKLREAGELETLECLDPQPEDLAVDVE